MGLEKMQDWKITDRLLANSERNHGLWKMTQIAAETLSVVFQSAIFRRSVIFSGRKSTVAQ